MSDPQDIADRLKKFLDYQQEIYAPLGSAEEIFQIRGSADITQEASPVKKSTRIKEQQDEIKTPASENASTLQSMTDKLNACKTLEELKLLCEESDILKTDLEGTNLVFGKGNPKADLVLIGEAPGAKEDELGEPFVGASGNLLTKILEAIKVDRKDIYIANILKHRPPDNRNPKAEERARSLPFLERQIDIIQPKLILCLGLISAQTLLNTTTALKDLRGSFHPYMGKYELMVTYHPAALLRNKHLKRDTWEDIQKLRARYDELDGKPVFAPYI